MSPASPPPRGIAACRWCTWPRRWSAWSMRRSAARPVSTSREAVPRPASGQEPHRAFWQPTGVVCDLDALAPCRRARCAAGAARWPSTTSSPVTICWRWTRRERIARCVEIKAEIVSSDERDGGRRALLNYGHTLAHALEIETDYRLAHGEAVAVGLIYAAHLARASRVGSTIAASSSTTTSSAGGYELDTRSAGGVDPQRLIDADGPRQEGAGDGLTFVLDSPIGCRGRHRGGGRRSPRRARRR